MTIELVTGTPGAGKTVFVVGRRLDQENGRKVEVEDEFGQKTTVERRICVAGIRGLAMPHERLPHTLTGERVRLSDTELWNREDQDGEALYKRLPGDPPLTTVPKLRRVPNLVEEVWEPDPTGATLDVEATVFNWWLWCKPGDLIVCDEVQFIIPRGTLGKKPPHYIKSLEIHRHYGVDFVFITQSPTLLDTTIRNLVGLHRHVRAVLGGPLCILYEWDHASNTERITNAAKRFFWRKRRWFKLYKSTVAVVTPPKSGRFAFIAAPILALVAAVGLPMFIGKFKPPEKGAAAPSGVVSAAVAAVPPPRAPGATGRSGELPGWVDVPKLSGCFAVGPVCRCMDRDMRDVQVADAMCRTSAASYAGLVRWEPRPALAVQAPALAASAPGIPASAILGGIRPGT